MTTKTSINWKIRLMDPVFWKTLVPNILLIVTLVASVFGLDLNLSPIGDVILEVIMAVLAVCNLFAIVRDPTTPGMGDSERALQYIEPGVLPDTSEE